MQEEGLPGKAQERIGNLKIKERLCEAETSSGQAKTSSGQASCKTEQTISENRNKEGSNRYNTRKSRSARLTRE
jgi:hypothetical protein